MSAIITSNVGTDLTRGTGSLYSESMNILRAPRPNSSAVRCRCTRDKCFANINNEYLTSGDLDLTCAPSVWVQDECLKAFGNFATTDRRTMSNADDLLVCSSTPYDPHIEKASQFRSIGSGMECGFCEDTRKMFECIPRTNELNWDLVSLPHIPDTESQVLGHISPLIDQSQPELFRFQNNQGVPAPPVCSNCTIPTNGFQYEVISQTIPSNCDPILTGDYPLSYQGLQQPFTNTAPLYGVHDINVPYDKCDQGVEWQGVVDSSLSTVNRPEDSDLVGDSPYTLSQPPSTPWLLNTSVNFDTAAVDDATYHSDVKPSLEGIPDIPDYPFQYVYVEDPSSDPRSDVEQGLKTWCETMRWNSETNRFETVL